jgi:hypothetical protein
VGQNGFADHIEKAQAKRERNADSNAVSSTFFLSRLANNGCH